MSFDMKKFLVVASLLLAGPAFGQSVQQSGTVTAKHVAAWVTSGVIGDGGSSASSPISSIGVTNNGGAGICVNSALPTSPGYQALCLGASTSGPAVISLQNFGNAPAESLNFVINGTVFPFPGALASLIINSTPVIGGANSDCLTVTGGVLTQVSCALLFAGTTGSGSIVLQNSPTLAGTIGGNLTFSGNELFSGTITAGSQFIVNGASAPPSISNQTVIAGAISPPVLANTGQAWLFNQAVAGATLQGDGSNFDITLLNKNGGVAMQIPTGSTGVTFPGILTLSGLSSGTCAASVVLNSSNQTITGSCPGAASSIQVGSTTVTSGTANNLLYNNAGTLGNNTIASFLTAGLGIGITGTTNATVATNFVAGTGLSITGSTAQTFALGGTNTAHGLIVWEGASSTLGNTGAGTVGQFAASGGASADPTMASGPWTLLNTLTASNSASLSDTTHVTSSYNEYLIVIENLLPATTSTTCELQVHSSGSFQVTGYLSSMLFASGTSTGAQSATTFIQCGVASSGQNSGMGVTGEIMFFNPSASSIHAFKGETVQSSTTSTALNSAIGGYWTTAAIIDGFQLISSSGNWASGTVKLYGRL